MGGRAIVMAASGWLGTGRVVSTSNARINCSRSLSSCLSPFESGRTPGRAAECGLRSHTFEPTYAGLHTRSSALAKHNRRRQAEQKKSEARPMHLHSSAQEHAQPLRLLPRLPFRIAACDDDRRRLVGVETKFLRTAKRRVHHRIPSLQCRIEAEPRPVRLVGLFPHVHTT